MTPNMQVNGSPFRVLRTATHGCRTLTTLSILVCVGCGSSSKGPVMDVKDVAYNTVVAGDGHASIAIYFSSDAEICDSESHGERRPGEVVAVALLDALSSDHSLPAHTYLVGESDPLAVVTLDDYDASCTLIPASDAASSGSVKVDAVPNDNALPLTADLTFGREGQTLTGDFTATFCPAITNRSGTGYVCPQ